MPMIRPGKRLLYSKCLGRRRWEPYLEWVEGEAVTDFLFAPQSAQRPSLVCSLPRSLNCMVDINRLSCSWVWPIRNNRRRLMVKRTWESKVNSLLSRNLFSLPRIVWSISRKLLNKETVWQNVSRAWTQEIACVHLWLSLPLPHYVIKSGFKAEWTRFEFWLHLLLTLRTWASYLTFLSLNSSSIN